jgi:hypothetical protein
MRFFGGLLMGIFLWMPWLHGQSMDPPSGLKHNSSGWLNRKIRPLLDTNSRSFWVYGIFNPYVNYRKLDKGYANTYGGLENFSTAPYPNLLSPTINTLQPTLLLRLGGSRGDLSFSVDYGLYYLYDADQTQKIRINGQNQLVANLELNKDFGRLKLSAGAGLMPLHFSQLILSNRYIREPLFDRVPWEYEASSLQRYQSRFGQALNGPSLYHQTSVQGFVLEADRLKGGWEGKAFFGRSQLQLFPEQVLGNVPSLISAFRIANRLSQKSIVGLQLYQKSAWTDTRKSKADNRTVASVDGKFLVGKGMMTGEVSFSHGQSPQGKNLSDPGAVLTWKQNQDAFSFYMQAFALGRNFLCLESEVYNSNSAFRQGGLLGDTNYNNFLFPSYLNPVGSLVNNRAGFDASVEWKKSDFSLSIGQQTSLELQNGGAELSFPHMINANTRSRFQPWQQYSGPYGRIGNRFRMSIERIGIREDAGKQRWFGSAFLDARYKFQPGRFPFFLSSYSALGHAGTQVWQTVWNLNAVFLRTYYQELELMAPLYKGIWLVGYAGVERNQASAKTHLSSENGKPLNQQGTGFGLGLDLEWAENSGLYLRHRWMDFSDKSYTLDAFQGQETVVECKITF